MLSGLMKKLTLSFTLLFSTAIFSSPSCAEWTKVSRSVNGDTFYVDYDRIRQQGGYRYFWQLQDYLKPTRYGILSKKMYNQVDCQLFRHRRLSSVVHKQPMGLGWWRTSPQDKPTWQYPSSGSVIEVVLKKICNR